MINHSDWYAYKEVKLMKKLETIIIDFPYFAKNYIMHKSETLKTDTLIIYGYRIRTFLSFLLETQYKNSDTVRTIQDLKTTVLDSITNEKVKDYLNWYNNRQQHNNKRTTLAEQIYILTGLYDYMLLKGWAHCNPFKYYKLSKGNDNKEINLLSAKEIDMLFSSINDLSNAKSSHQKAYLKKTQQRDYVLVALILNTGLRISECQGLNIEDVDTNENRIKVIRKNKPTYIYLNTEINHIMKDYIACRKFMITKYPDDPALFLSLRKTRISLRAIQKLVTKMSPRYAEETVTPQTLRNTYGVNLLAATSNEQLVGAVLDCTTNTAHYAQVMKPDKRQAANVLTIVK